MILAITEQYHDYQPRLYLLDTGKLDPANPVDAEVLKVSAQPGQTGKVFLNAGELGIEEPNVTQAAKVVSGVIEKAILLTIQFE